MNTKGDTKMDTKIGHEEPWEVLALVSCSASRLRDLRVSSFGQAPQRIVSLFPAVTEMLFAIGAGPQVVAVSSYDANRPRCGRCRASGRCSIPTSSASFRSGPTSSSPTGRRPISSNSSSARRSRCSTIDTPDWRTSPARSAAGRASPGTPRRPSGRPEASRAPTMPSRSARRRPGPRTSSCSAARRGALRNIYASGGRGFLHDMLEAAGGDDVLRGHRPASRCRSAPRLVLARAPDVILEVRSAAISGRTMSRPRKRGASVVNAGLGACRAQPAGDRPHRAGSHRARPACARGRRAHGPGASSHAMKILVQLVIRQGLGLDAARAQSASIPAPSADCSRPRTKRSIASPCTRSGASCSKPRPPRRDCPFTSCRCRGPARMRSTNA